MAFIDLIADADLAVQEHLGGEPVLYRPASGPAVTVTGIFDAQYVLVQSDSEVGVESSGPAVFLRIADLPINPEQDDPTITVAGVDYVVNDRKPDGIGGIVLALHRKVM